MKDITREETQDGGKKKALEVVKGALKEAGLNADDYDLFLHKKTTIKAAPNIQLFQTAAYLAATTLTPSANKILMYFLSLSHFENYVNMDQKTLQEDLKISLSATEKGLKELHENGVIIKTKHPTDKRRNDYFINPMSAWKGKILNRKQALNALHSEVKNQLHLFGEGYEENQIREKEEIKAKQPSLMTLKTKDIVEGIDNREQNFLNEKKEK